MSKLNVNESVEPAAGERTPSGTPVPGRKVYVKVPASTANLGPGFDTLGMALNLYAWIEMAAAEKTTIRMFGDRMNGVATDKTNLIYQVAQMVFRKAGIDVPELDIAFYSDIPLTRGLGSSAAAIVGGMVAANELIGNPLSDDELFRMATELERHPDNVGASLFGGLVVTFWDGERTEYIRIVPDDRLEVLVAIPEFELSTKKSRNVLPERVALKDAVFNVSHSSLLVAAFCTGQYDKIRYAMKDALHQPYRSPLIPGMNEILERAESYGALGAALSGAGPTVLALVDSQNPDKARLESFLLDTLRERGIKATSLWLKPCPHGARVLTHFDSSCTLIENIKGEVRA